jgi:hypothetical protein
MEILNKKMVSKYNYLTDFLNEIKVVFSSIRNNIKMIVFGGFIRDLIIGDEFNDIDIYIDNMSISANTCLYIIKNKIKKSFSKFDNIKNIIIDFNVFPDTRDIYGTYKITLLLDDDKEIIFDISLIINSQKKIIFNKTCDYSVNNLCAEFSDEKDKPFKNLSLRISNETPNIETTIEHIKNKILIPIISVDDLSDLIIIDLKYFYNVNERNNKKVIKVLITTYLDKIVVRTTKLKNKYTFDDEYDFDKFINTKYEELMESVKSKLCD